MDSALLHSRPYAQQQCGGAGCGRPDSSGRCTEGMAPSVKLRDEAQGWSYRGMVQSRWLGPNIRGLLLNGRWPASPTPATTASATSSGADCRAQGRYCTRQEQGPAGCQTPLPQTRDHTSRDADRLALPEVFFPGALPDHRDGEEEITACCFDDATLDRHHIGAHKPGERIAACGSEVDRDARSRCRISRRERGVLVAAGETCHREHPADRAWKSERNSRSHLDVSVMIRTRALREPSLRLVPGRRPPRECQDVGQGFGSLSLRPAFGSTPGAGIFGLAFRSVLPYSSRP